MGLLFANVLLELGVTLAALVAAAYFYFTRNFRAWAKKGIPYVTPVPFFGNYKDVVLARKTTGVVLRDIYLEAEGKPYIGIFSFDIPMLVVRDNELVKNVLVKDFNVFFDRNFKPDIGRDPLLGRGLFASTGGHWRILRTKLTPTFTSGKMKRMFYLVDECGKQLVTYMDKLAENGVLDAKDAMARFNINVISTCAFGIEGDALSNERSVFRAVLKRVFESMGLLRGAAFIAAFFTPSLSKVLKLQVVDDKATTFIRDTVWSTVEYREKNSVVRKDFLDLLMQLRNNGQVQDDDASDVPQKGSDNFELTGDDFVAQAFTFLTAGYETSSTTISFALYELSLHSEIQTRLREEIQSVLKKNDGQVTYEGIKDMTYLDKVVAETLRKYPVLPFLDRKALVPYTLPDGDIQLDKDSVVLIPVLGIHYDPKYYPNPDRFDPENFSEERKRARPNYTYLPFGDGPRNCIGNRMALMQTKVGLVYVLSHYEVKPCRETPIPIHFDPFNVLLNAKGGLPLSFSRLSVLAA